MKNITLYPSKVKIIFLFLISLLFTVGGIIWIREEFNVKALFVVIFFCICTITFIIILMPNSSFLKLTSKGFEVRSLYRSHYYNWKDISNFDVIRVVLNKMVGFNLSNKRMRNSIHQSSQNLVGMDDALPVTYGYKPENLAKLLNEWKNKYSK